jgi:hypothetical protein
VGFDERLDQIKHPVHLHLFIFGIIEHGGHPFTRFCTALLRRRPTSLSNNFWEANTRSQTSRRVVLAVEITMCPSRPGRFVRYILCGCIRVDSGLHVKTMAFCIFGSRAQYPARWFPLVEHPHEPPSPPMVR